MTTPNPEASTKYVRWFNASILVNGETRGAYGVFLDDMGNVIRCSEHSAKPDPVGWLSKRYPSNTYTLVEDNGDAYYEDHYRVFPELRPKS